MSTRLRLTDTELAELAAGRVTPSLAARAAAKLKPPEPIRGQLDLVHELAKEDDAA